MEQLYKNWTEAQSALAIAKKVELALRREVILALPGELGPTTTLFEQDSISFVITRSLRYKLDEDEFLELADTLSLEELDCVDYKPVLNVKLYKKLSIGNVLSRAVTATPSLPSIKIVELK